MHRAILESLFLGIIVLITPAVSDSIQAQSIDVWIGTSRSAQSKGIYTCKLDTVTGKLSEPELAAEISGPGFLAMHPSRPCLYAVGTLNEVPSVVAYEIVAVPKNRSELRLINSAEIGDGGAAHVAVDPTGKLLLTAQYGGGSVAVFALNSDGSIDRRTQLIKHKGGSKVVDGRQDAPHAHWVGFSPDNRFAFVPDLGLDEVVIYRVDATTLQLVPHGSGKVPPGGGPRHMKFHPNGKWIYVLNELDLSVSVFDYNASEGTMALKQTIPTVPKEELQREQFVSASEIRIHPTGQYVYSANRGHDTITSFHVHPEMGTLDVIERVNLRSATPRNFNLNPSARWLITAGQDSHNLVVFAVDPVNGRPVYNRNIVQVPSPICVLFQHE